MDVTIFSVLMSFLWFSVFALLFSLCIKNSYLMHRMSIWFPASIALLCILRAILPLDIPSAKVIPSHHFLPKVRQLLYHSIGNRLTVWQLLLLAYALVTCILLIRLLIQYLSLNRWIKSLPLCSDPDIIHCAKTSARTNATPLVYRSNAVSVPISAGFFTPKLLLPAYELNTKQLSFITAHELMHFKSKDLWAKLFLNIFICFLWWNPLAYLLKNRLDHFLELKCDTLVTANYTETEIEDYFATVACIYKKAQLAKYKTPAAALGLVSARSDKQLRQRFLLGITDKQPRHMLVSWVLTACLVVLLVFSYSFIFQSSSAPKDDADLFEINCDNSYLADNMDGTYSLFVDGEFRFLLEDATLLETEPFSTLSIQGGTL